MSRRFSRIWIWRRVFAKLRQAVPNFAWSACMRVFLKGLEAFLCRTLEEHPFLQETLGVHFGFLGPETHLVLNILIYKTKPKPPGCFHGHTQHGLHNPKLQFASMTLHLTPYSVNSALRPKTKPSFALITLNPNWCVQTLSCPSKGCRFVNANPYLVSIALNPIEIHTLHPELSRLIKLNFLTAASLSVLSIHIFNFKRLPRMGGSIY